MVAVGGICEEDLERYMAADYRPLVSSLTLICGNRSMAEEAAQEALLRAWQSPGHGAAIESLPAWVRTVAVNHLKNDLRRLGRERRALHRLADTLETEVPDGPASVAADVDLIRTLSRLSRRQREVAVLHYRFGLSLAQTAETLGLAEGTVKALLHRARASLLTLVSQEGGTSVD